MIGESEVGSRCLFALPVPRFFSLNRIRAYILKRRVVVEVGLDGVIRIYGTRDEKSSFAIFNSKTDHDWTELSVRCIFVQLHVVCLLYFGGGTTVHSTPSATLPDDAIQDLMWWRHALLSDTKR